MARTSLKQNVPDPIGSIARCVPAVPRKAQEHPSSTIKRHILDNATAKRMDGRPFGEGGSESAARQVEHMARGVRHASTYRARFPHNQTIAILPCLKQRKNRHGRKKKSRTPAKAISTSPVLRGASQGTNVGAHGVLARGSSTIRRSNELAGISWPCDVHVARLGGGGMNCSNWTPRNRSWPMSRTVVTAARRYDHVYGACAFRYASVASSDPAGARRPRVHGVWTEGTAARGNGSFGGRRGAS